MKKIVNGELRDTEHMELLISGDNGLTIRDLYYADYSIFADGDRLYRIEGCVRWVGNSGGYAEVLESVTRVEALETVEQYQTTPTSELETWMAKNPK